MAGAERTSPGFVLRSVEYGERDRILTLYAREAGKFSAIAKNARGSERRFGGGLQPMQMLNLRWVEKPNRDLDRLDSIEIEEEFEGIQRDYDRITVGSYATDLFRGVTVERNKEPELFDLLVDFYRRLVETEPRSELLEIVLRHFQLRLFAHVGEAPAVRRCLRCGTHRGALSKVYALRTGEGIVCPECVRTGESVGVVFPETFEILGYLRAPRGEPPAAFGEPDLVAQARRFIEAAQRRILEGKTLPSREMLETTLEAAFET